MNKRCSSILVAVALVALAGPVTAQSACENLRVDVRNSLFEIFGLGAFCAEFDKMKADLASLKTALSDARAENARLEARLAAHDTQRASAGIQLEGFRVITASRAKE